MVLPAITANDIESWAKTRLDARSHLPVLLRRLIHATGRDLRRVDLPGHDDAERRGPDGVVEAGTATAWVPRGHSFWELGTSAKPQAKAEHDYAASLTKHDAATRAAASFVFVTPRRWVGKAKWAQSKRAAGDWADIRVLDASDLEQWLEQAPSVGVWLAGQLGWPTAGLESLDDAWRRWADATDPKLPLELFTPSLPAATRRLGERLSGPPEPPIRVAADSRDEALAFLARVLAEPALQPWGDRAVIVTTADALRWLAETAPDALPIIAGTEAARELGRLPRRPVIVLDGGHADRTEPAITPAPLDHASFDKALAAIGITGERADRLARESARSPTILRRRLARDPLITTPDWAGDHQKRRTLVPLALLGAWRADRPADREIVARIAGRDAAAVEADLAALLMLDDSPVWSTADHRGVVSRLDALLLAVDAITRDDLERFFAAARTVLAERDPALDLPEAERWAAAIHGKERRHSGTLRDSLAETLILLAVHGHARLHARTGIDVAARVEWLVRELLTPLTTARLRSLGRTLRHLAEAAPEPFLACLEPDLREPEPALLGLLAPVDGDPPFTSPPRIDLLWALELLAWNPRHLPRVVLILARLATLEIADTWTNRPINSLRAIFRSWVPQTAASVEQRIAALRLLAERHPRVAWRIASAQLERGHLIGSYSVRPRWREDAGGKGEPVTHGERCRFERAALDLMLAWPGHDETTLSDLVATLDMLPDADQQRIWSLIDTWSQGASDEAKATLRTAIRSYSLTWRSSFRNLPAHIVDRCREACDRLAPADPVIRHRWLFAERWVEPPGDALPAGETGLDERWEALDRLRYEALTEI